MPRSYRLLASALLSILLASGRGAFAADPQAPMPAPGGTGPPPARFADHEAWSRAHAGLRAALESGDLGKAEDRALTLLREAVHFPPSDPRLKPTQEVMAALAAKERLQARAEYVRFCETSLAVLEREGGPTHQMALVQLAELAGIRHQRGEVAAAAAHFEEIRRRTAGDGANAVFWIAATIELAEIELERRAHARATSLATEARELATRVFGPENKFVFSALVVESRAARVAGRRDEAARSLSRALGLVARIAPNHPGAAMARLDYGTLLLELCRHDEARRELQSAADGLVASLGGADPRVVDAFRMLATAESLRGDWTAARPAAERALAAAEELALRAGAAAELPRRKLIETRVLLAEIDLALERNAEAKSVLERARSLRGAPSGAHEQAELGSRLALAELALGNAGDARRLAEEALRVVDAGSVPPLPAAELRVHAAEVFVRTGDFARGEELATRALPPIEGSIAPAERLLRALRVLAQAQAGSGKGEAALGTLARARTVGTECFGPSSPLLGPVAREEAAVLASLGRGGEEAEARQRAEAIAEGAARAAGSAPGAARLEDPALNLALRPPPPPWAPIEPEAGLAVTPRFAFARAEPSIRFGVVANDTGAPADLRDQEVLARALDTFGATTEGVETRLITRKERAIHGIVGVQIVYRHSDAERSWYVVNWLGSRAGMVYWLYLSSEEAGPEALGVEAQALFEGLSVLDPGRVASPLAAATTFRSERFGYSIDLSGTELGIPERRVWPERVDFAATLSNADPRLANLLVIPVALSGVRADPERVDEALCALVDPDVRWGTPRTVDVAGARGREFDATLMRGSELVSYRARVFQRGGVGVAVGVMVSRAPQADLDALLGAVARVRLDESFRSPAASEPDERELMRQALFWNALGVALSRAGRPAEAIAPFERSLGLHASDPVIARNLAEARFRAGRTRDSVRGLDEALVRYPKDPLLLGWRGLGHAVLGDPEAAASDLGRAIELGNAAEEILAAYVVALVRLERIDAALAALAARIDQTNSPGARVLRTAVLRRAGRQKEAIAELRELSRQHPTDLLIQGAMADAAIEAGDPAAFLEATEEFAGPDDEPGLLVLYLRALAQKALGRHEDAIASLERALQLAPDSAELRALRDRFEEERRGGGRST